MADELEKLRDSIGRKSTEEDVITASQAGRLAVALGVDLPARKKGDPIPPGWHGVFFPTLAPLAALREDGQPGGGGGVMPGVPLPRRRIVAVRGTFHDPLRVGDDVVKETELTNVTIEDYGTGPTVLLTITDRISSPRGLAVTDERDFFFYGMDGPGQEFKLPDFPPSAPWQRTYEPNMSQIVRLSAARFNSHRIHYDREYTTKVEGYAGIVVPVTLVTFLLMELCRAEAPERPLKFFGYQSIEPVCDCGPYSIFGIPEGDQVTMWGTDYKGDISVTAEATLS